MLRKIKNIFIPSGETQKVQTFESYTVRWNSFHHDMGYCAKRKKEVEIFPSKEEAQEFANQLEKSANMLNVKGINVKVEKNSTGIE